MPPTNTVGDLQKNLCQPRVEMGGGGAEIGGTLNKNRSSLGQYNRDQNQVYLAPPHANAFIFLIDRATQEVPMKNILKKLSVQFLRYTPLNC